MWKNEPFWRGKLKGKRKTRAMSKEAALERLFRFCTFLDCPSSKNTRSTPKMRFLVKSLTKQLSKGDKCFTWGRLDHNGGGKMSVEKVLKQNNWIILPRLLNLGGQSLWARMEGLCSRGTRGINSGEATHSDLLQSWFYYVAYCYSIQYTYLVIKLKNVRSGTCLDYPKNTVYSLPGVCL